jgi:hypothetical protein
VGEPRLGARRRRLERRSVDPQLVRPDVRQLRTAVGSLEVFIFLATYFYIAAIILLVAMELDELVRLDLRRPRSRQELLPLITGVIRGTP